jgi:hypothetical protein
MSVLRSTNIIYKLKSKAIPATGGGEPCGCEMLRFPHCLENRLIDGGEVLGLTRQPPLYSPEILFFFF